MTDDEIVDLFDSTNITLAELSLRSGRSVDELKALLMFVLRFPNCGGQL